MTALWAWLWAHVVLAAAALHRLIPVWEMRWGGGGQQVEKQQ